MQQHPNPEQSKPEPSYYVPADPYAEVGIESLGWMVQVSLFVSLMFTAATPVVGLLMVLNLLFRFKRVVTFIISYPADSALSLTFLILCAISSRLMFTFFRPTKGPLHFERCNYLAHLWFIAFGLNGLVLIYMAISSYS